MPVLGLERVPELGLERVPVPELVPVPGLALVLEAGPGLVLGPGLHRQPSLRLRAMPAELTIVSFSLVTSF